MERVPVQVPQYRGHTIVLKNCSTSFGNNRKSVTKVQKLQLNLPPKLNTQNATCFLHMFPKIQNVIAKPHTTL